MKLLTYSHNGELAVGVLKKDGSQVVPVHYLGFDVKDMNAFLEQQDEEKLAKMDRNKDLMQGIPVEEVQLYAPILYPKQEYRDILTFEAML